MQLESIFYLVPIFFLILAYFCMDRRHIRLIAGPLTVTGAIIICYIIYVIRTDSGIARVDINNAFGLITVSIIGVILFGTGLFLYDSTGYTAVIRYRRTPSKRELIEMRYHIAISIMIISLLGFVFSMCASKPFIVLKWTMAASFLIGTILLIFLLLKIDITPKDSEEAFEELLRKRS